jgi:hypothetical protein
MGHGDHGSVSNNKVFSIAYIVIFALAFQLKHESNTRRIGSFQVLIEFAENADLQGKLALAAVWHRAPDNQRGQAR